MMSKNYDHNPDHYRFVRHHTGQAPEPSAPLSSWAAEILRLGGIVLFCAVLWLLAWALA